ncbi:MAG: polymorphic toxin type 44 domain-containing protein [Paracoccaceae bacterium]
MWFGPLCGCVSGGCAWNHAPYLADVLGLEIRSDGKRKIALHPSDVDIDENIGEAEQQSYPIDLLWFYNQVKTNGPWDYKQRNTQFENFGSFNYGATGTAMGIPERLLRRQTGIAQLRNNTSKPEWGKPGGGPPYGDDPNDQTKIGMGIDYFTCGCHER